MSELQDMLRVQARLHRKQGANALGQLFESAIEEIQLLNKTYNQLFDAFQDCQGELAKANERVEGLELHANRIADALGFNAENNNRFATSVICTNIRNLHSFSDCLSRIENAFLMVESETDEFGETSEDVAFSKWGLTPHEYCIEFGKWLNKFALEKKIEALDDLLEEIKCSVVVPKRYEQLQEPYLEGIKHCIQFIECQSEQLRKEQE